MTGPWCRRNIEDSIDGGTGYGRVEMRCTSIVNINIETHKCLVNHVDPEDVLKGSTKTTRSQDRRDRYFPTTK